jgi:hypothetical protein
MLWTIITIRELPVPQDPSPATLQATEGKMGLITDMVSTFIRRAGTCSMALHLGASDRDIPFDLPEYTTTIEPFASALCQARWKTLDIVLQFRQPSSPLLQLLKITRRSSNTLLGVRFMLHTNSLNIAMNVADHLALMRATQLTSLGLGVPARALVDPKINWRSLTDLSLYGGVAPAQALSVLSQCPNLVKCTLELHTGRTPTFTPPVNSVGSIILPHLQDFTISGFQPIDLPQSLTLPTLCSLALVDKMEMYTEYSGEPPLDTALPEWIHLHGTKLTRLMLSYGRITLPTLLSCLEGAPNLLSIEIQPALMSRIDTQPPIGDGRVTSFPLAALLALEARFDETGERLTQPCSCP